MIKRYARNHKSKKVSSGIKSSDLAFTPYTLRRRVHLKNTYQGEKDKRIVEPYPVCAYCGKKILHIVEAFKINDGYVHFDCALNKAKDKMKEVDGDKVSYIGSGKFAKIERVENKAVESQNSNAQKNRQRFEFKIDGEYQIEDKANFEKICLLVEGSKK